MNPVTEYDIASKPGQSRDDSFLEATEDMDAIWREITHELSDFKTNSELREQEIIHEHTEEFNSICNELNSEPIPSSSKIDEDAFIDLTGLDHTPVYNPVPPKKRGRREIPPCPEIPSYQPPASRTKEPKAKKPEVARERVPKLIASELDPKRARPAPERERDPGVPRYYKRTSNYMSERFMLHLDIPGETIPDVRTVMYYPWSARPCRGSNIEDDITLHI